MKYTNTELKQTMDNFYRLKIESDKLFSLKQKVNPKQINKYFKARENWIISSNATQAVKVKLLKILLSEPTAGTCTVTAIISDIEITD